MTIEERRPKGIEEAPPEIEITEEERTWAILSHVSILLSVLTGGLLGPVAAFVIWLIKKDQSPYVGRQALQSLIYQLVVVVLSWIMWIGIAMLSALVVGICCIPGALWLIWQLSDMAAMQPISVPSTGNLNIL